MARGQYDRKLAAERRQAAGYQGNNNVVKPILKAVQNETDEEIDARISNRFEISETMVQAAIDGQARALIISGPAGLGKSFTVEQALEAWDPDQRNHTIVKGRVAATGLYKLLWRHKAEGQVIVFDDADGIFFDETSLNLMKGACDTNDKRIIGWHAETTFVSDEDGEVIERSFEFRGTIIFITNQDFDAHIEKGHRLTPHFQALISRSHYIDLAMKTQRDYIVRIKQVVRLGLLDNVGLSHDEQRQVVDFVIHNQNKMRELSLRMVLKVAALRKISRQWENVARVTCCKNAA